MYNKLADFVLQELKNNNNVSEIYEKSKEVGYNSGFTAFRLYVNRLKKKQKNINSTVKLLDEKLIRILTTKRVLKVPKILNQLNCNKRTLNKIIKYRRRNGYEINIENDNVILSTTNVRDSEEIKQISTCNEIVFGVISDPHFGSRSCQITALNEFSEIMKRKGVKHIFCPGDLVAGFDVYPGQVHDVYAISAQEQEQSTILNLPSGFEWYVLGGNHDYSFIKRGGGYNIISVIANKRKDVHYVGFDQATIPILNNVDVMMGHPSGGLPYSVSYRLQKNIEQITISELQNVVRGVKDKPTIRFVLLGHLHIQMQAMFGSIFGVQCGTFEGQTNYLKRKGLIPCIGGWIIKASLGNNGLLKNFDSKFYIFDEIENDWKNYNHTIPEEKITKPIFNEF